MPRIARNRNTIYPCPECNYQSSYPQQTARHFLRHTGEKPFKCGYCEYRTSRKYRVKQHQETHASRGTHPSLATIKKAGFPVLEIEEAPGTVKLPLSKLTSTPSIAGKRVVIIKKSKGKKQKRKLAPRKSSSSDQSSKTETPSKSGTNSEKSGKKENLEDVGLNQRSVRKIYFCPDCDYRSSNLPVFESHVESHTEMKKEKEMEKINLECGFCTYTSTEFDELAKHLLHQHSEIDGEEKPEFQQLCCEFCNYKTMSSSRLSSHERNFHY